MKKQKLFILSISINVILILALSILLVKSGYGNKILIKLGITEPTIETDWSLFSWQSCLKNLELDCDVVFFGDSITRASAFQNYFEDVSICNLGLSGDTLSGMQERTEMIASVKPEKIFIMGGINDLVNFNGDFDILINKYNSLLDSVKKECPEAEIYVESLLPINPEKYGNSISNENIISFNKLLEQTAKEHKIKYINLYDLYAVNNTLPEALTEDGIHLKSDAYDKWAEAIRVYIK
ncbi:MAG: GDSL-type esterase/lipase family protein [Clostridia bacterium]|nr:GDSL-type esterase/lipase family protein [Clostridia bacterium]